MPDLVSVVVVDDHPLFRDGVVATLKANKTFRVLGQGGTAADAVSLCRRLAPDILLLDLNLPNASGLSVIGEISNGSSPAKIVVLTASERETDVSAALEAGARGYVLKGTSAPELLNTLKSVHQGSTYVAPQLAGELLRQMHRRLHIPDIDCTSALTPREQQILDRVSEGMMNKEIARKLNISEKTVKHYMTNIMQKLQVRNRVEAVIAARQKTSANFTS